MKAEIRSKEISPTFSVRIDIADTEKKLVFTCEGDKETSELFLMTLHRLSQRMENAQFFEKPLYNMEYTKDQEMTISMSKEQIEELLHSILLL